MTRDQIKGMFLGIAIGDALGMPVETLTAEEITRRFVRITHYLRPDGHKWFDGFEAGKWTDDTQLTVAIAESLIEKGTIDLDDVAAQHIKAMKECDIGWGKSTKESIQRIKDGIHWKESGNPDGAGNGVAMKVAPIGAYLVAKLSPAFKSWVLDEKEKRVITALAFMTHQNRMAISSAFAQIFAITSCLEKENFSTDDFFRRVVVGCVIGEGQVESDKLLERIKLIQKIMHKGVALTDDQIIKTFDQGTCYVYDSLPFSYAFFLRNPYSIETLYDVISAGGDTDTNGSMVGALLGALNGIQIFPQHLIDRLWRKDEIVEISNRFCNRFGIK